ncbi:MAG TPA: beta-eliminating lyase-related protein, partial [Candidatus Limnocylindrales bacterium]|nr:beta-eliminating lyase-related protein [Candidatus Limnocylindrales bacterium]
GPAAFIDDARHHRQMLGGGMRQAGIVAAGGLHALRHNVTRLADDHANARRLADGLRAMPGLIVDRENVETNIFYVDVVRDDMTAADFVDRLRDAGVLVNLPSAGRRTVRFVTHFGIEAADIEAALATVADVLGVPARAATAGTARSS